MWCYARILAHYPYVVLLAVLVVSLTCLIVSIAVGDLPGFQDPMAGFEARGTELSDKLISYDNLVHKKPHALSLLPGLAEQDMDAVIQKADNKLLVVNSRARAGNTKTAYTRANNKKFRRKRKKSEFFHDTPSPKYAKIVFSSSSGENLLTATNLRTMCDMEDNQLRSNPHFLSSCSKDVYEKACWRSLNLGNYVALLTNKSKCQDVTDRDVTYVLDLLQFCVQFYRNFSLRDDCYRKHSPFGESRSDCSGIPRKCKWYNAVYNIFHYITDISFLNPQPKVRYAMSYLPVSFHAGSVETLQNAIEFFKSFEKELHSIGTINIVAADFGIKYSLFQYYLEKDSSWLALSGVIIFLTVWFYTSSIFLTFMTFCTMFWSLELAYFLYTFVFEIEFFPYMNLVTVLLIIAVGADDVFIYTKIWHLAKKERNNGTLEKLVSDTLKHATLSMVVTSLTTAGALCANLVSPITSIQCFSIFAALTVLCNLALMITWIPASIIVQEKWCNCCFINSPRCYRKLKSYYRMFFENFLPMFVIRLRYVWIFLLGGLGVFGGVVIFHYPKLRLPTSFKFQVFRKEHLMEMYDQEISDYFSFERSFQENTPLMPIKIIWGVKSEDNGKRLNPEDSGYIGFDNTFDLTNPRAQEWLLDFCQKLRLTDFYEKVEPIEVTNCFLEQFRLYMKHPCQIATKHYNVFPCCNKSLPYSREVLLKCFKMFFNSTKSLVDYDYESPGPRFLGGQLSALIVQFSSNVEFSYNFDEMNDFYEKVKNWVAERLDTAPKQMANGWFVSDFKFFSIQKSLSEGLPLAFGISLLVATVVTFLTSLNILITLYAIITLACILLVTVAALVLLGWELGILETVVVTVAVGMSVDYTLHYGVAYRLSPDLDRDKRVVCSLTRVGNVIFMAAFTTFLAGLAMMPSVTLVYQKFGIFLMLIISISWVYSTFFFQALLNVLGPQGGFGQFHWPSSECCNTSPNRRVDKTVYGMSESTLSSSSSSYPYHTSSEPHEQDPLTESHSHAPTPIPHHRSRMVRHGRSRSGSNSPEVQTRRKLLNTGEEIEVTVSVETQAVPKKQCTEV